MTPYSGRGLYSNVLREVLAKIKPTPQERRKVGLIVSKLLKALKEARRYSPVEFKVELEGSVAKDTWISGDRDIDIFILFPKNISIEELKAYGLKVARICAKEVGGEFRERYAEHPYLEVFLDSYRADLVPAFSISDPKEALTAVDRTPFHTKYVREKLDPRSRDEVRLLKRFLKGIGAYGAEKRIGGFSGYLAELLIIKYGSFLNVLEGVSKWRPFKIFIDIEGYYNGVSARVAEKAFGKAPLIVIDPVDYRRNAAASVTLEKLATFIAASKYFLKRPSLNYFFPPKPPSLDLRKVLKERGTTLLMIELPCPKLPPDILWGEIYRSMEGFRNLLRTHSFEVLSSGVWSDESNEVIFLFELLRGELPKVEKHLGPPVSSANEDSFLEKYLRGRRALAGPFIEGGRWVVFRARRYLRARDLIIKEADKVKQGKHLVELLKYLKVYEGDGALKRMESLEPELKEYLIRWLIKKPPWLEPYEGRGAVG